MRSRRLAALILVQLLMVSAGSFAQAETPGVGTYVEIVTTNNKTYVGKILSLDEQKTVLQLELGGEIEITNASVSTRRVFEPNGAYVSLGVSFGRPAGINAAVAYTVSQFRFGVEAMYLPIEYGINVDAVFLFQRFRYFQHGIAINAGYFKENDPDDSRFQGSWAYIGPSYYVSLRGWSLNLGASYGTGTFKQPQPILGLAYLYDFQ